MGCSNIKYLPPPLSPLHPNNKMQNDGAGPDEDDGDDDDDEDRGLPSFKISKARHKRGGSSDGAGGVPAGRGGSGSRVVQPLAGPGSGPSSSFATGSRGVLGAPGGSGGNQQPVADLLDLNDLFGGGGADAAADSSAAGTPPVGEGVGAGAGAGAGVATVDLMADIFSAPVQVPPAFPAAQVCVVGGSGACWR